MCVCVKERKNVHVCVCVREKEGTSCKEGSVRPQRTASLRRSKNCGCVCARVYVYVCACLLCLCRASCVVCAYLRVCESVRVCVFGCVRVFLKEKDQYRVQSGRLLSALSPFSLFEKVRGFLQISQCPPPAQCAQQQPSSKQLLPRHL